MDLVIRPMTPEDISGEAYVHWQSWRETYEGLVDPDWLAARTLKHCEDMARRFSDNTLVAVKENRIIGFGIYAKSTDRDLPEAGEVVALYVLRAHWGQGIGRELMAACLEGLGACPQVLVWVLAGNARAIRFYKGCGFVQDGARQSLTLGTPVEAVRMVMRRQSVTAPP